MLQPGETVGLDGTSPLRLKIGNASATRVTYKGEGVDLAPVTSRDNVAKLELK
jgi:cytoskeleton protein RodZ